MGTENPPAFPLSPGDVPYYQEGMSLRDYFAGQALANPEVCSGEAPEYLLKRWFRGERLVSRAEIIAAQAYAAADAMLLARNTNESEQSS